MNITPSISRFGTQKTSDPQGHDWVVGPCWGGGKFSVLALIERKRIARAKKKNKQSDLDLGIDPVDDMLNGLSYQSPSSRGGHSIDGVSGHHGGSGSGSVLDGVGGHGGSGGGGSVFDGVGSGGGSGGGGGFLDGLGDEAAIFMLGLLAILLALALVFGVILPVLVIGIEIFIVLLLGLAATAVRFAFGTPWTIEAKSTLTGQKLHWKIKGYRNMKVKVQEVTQAIGRGDFSGAEENTVKLAK